MRQARVAIFFLLLSSASGWLCAAPAAEAAPRAGAAPGTFVDPTGLTWIADAGYPLQSGLSDRLVLTLPDALARVRALNRGVVNNFGHDDWRLATPAEVLRRLAHEEKAATGAGDTNAALLHELLAQKALWRTEPALLVPVRGAALIPQGFPSVVVFATNSIFLAQSTQVVSGDVVANDASPGPVLDSGVELSVGPQATTPAGAAVKGDSVKVNVNAVVGGDVFYNDLLNLGTINGTLNTPLPLPVFASLPFFEPAAPGVQDVVVPRNGTLTLPAGAYALLDVKQGATVFFTGGAYDFASITVGPDALLLFDAPSDVKVAGKVVAQRSAVIGPSAGSTAAAPDIVFFVAGINGVSGGLGEAPSAAEFGARAALQANFYVPNGTLHLQSHTTAAGAFLARDVLAGPQATLTLASAFFNRPPVAEDDSATVEVGGTVGVLDSGETSVLANDSDPDAGDSLTAALVSGPAAGSLTLNPDGTFSYTHDGSDTLADSFVYEACDEGFPVLCDTATVSITVFRPPYVVTILKAGTGTGVVTSGPAGIDCGLTCSAEFPALTVVTLIATPDPGSVFVGWSGGGDCSDGQVVGPPDVTCTATFDEPTPITLAVQKLGTGGGLVTSDPAGIDCGATCSFDFPQFTRVALTPTAGAGSIFVGFGGDPDCLDGFVAMNVPKTCTATFDTFTPPPPPPAVTLTVQKAGDGSGFVSSAPAGISCGATCAAEFPQFSRVELQAVADPGSVFGGFGGDPDCADGLVALAAATTCTATFDLLPPPPASSTLTVVKEGTGDGSITSSPAGIECGAVCDATFTDGTVVTLFVRPDPGTSFVGWGGDCSGTAFFTTVTVGPDRTCTATFSAP